MTTMIKTTNPYSGQSELLTEEEHKLYTQVKQDEIDERYDAMQKGLSKFSRLNPKAYMTLLDSIRIRVARFARSAGVSPFNSGNHFQPGI